MNSLERPAKGDVNHGTSFMIIAALFLALSVITTSVRVAVRSVKHQLGWDDYAISLATILALVEIVFNGLEVKEGAGRHAFYLSTGQQQRSLKWVYVTQYFLFIIICTTKIGICLFILRIKNTGWLRWCLFALMAGLVLTTLPCIIILSAQCRPIRAFWDPQAGTCWSKNIYNNAIWVQVGFSIFSDLICSLLPAVVLWNVRISRNLKLAVCGLMSVGLLATGSAAARASLSGNNKDPDLTWNLALISIWGALEENFGIIGANLALSRVLYVYWRGDKSLPRGERRYPQQSDFTGRGFRPTAGWRRNLYSSARSQDSVIPLEDTTIKKTTDLYVIREPRDESNMSGANAGLGGRTFVVEDRI